MRFTDDEKAMLDGKEGPARQKAMELLVHYAEALGAERFVDTNNAYGTVGAAGPYTRDLAGKEKDQDTIFCEFILDTPEVFEIPEVKVFSCHGVQPVDLANWQLQGVTPEVRDANRRSQEFAARIGLQLMSTCTPYLVGNVPVKGEHCAWIESSAVVYCNSVLGARTNTEGRQSAGAAMMTGKIPYWGYHLDENRLGTHRVDVELDVESVMDWGLLGYYVGEIVQERVPVLRGIGKAPSLSRLKHFGAAAASSGGVEMYHIVGVTPEARTLRQAFGARKPAAALKFGEAERRQAYHNLNSSARDDNVDFVGLGCPHYSIEQIWEACRLLGGRRVHDGMHLWIFTPRPIKDIADRNGYTKLITDAGATLMTDTCPALGQVHPIGTRVVATDSAKQAHYLPAILGFQAWFGSQADCIEAAITGRWRGELP